MNTVRHRLARRLQRREPCLGSGESGATATILHRATQEISHSGAPSRLDLPVWSHP